MKVKKIISVVLVAALIAGICVMTTVSSGASGTGIGLAEWALNAYNANWRYVYGGASPGAVDCSGLIYSYAGGYRVGDAQTFNSDYRGYLSNGIPNIHGLGLYKPGHVGVYVGGGMAVDARGDDYGVCYESVYSHGWTQYFKVPGVSYPSTGWEQFCGNYYYYENGEYLANTSREIGGTTYYFDGNGISSSTPISGSASSSDSSSETSSASSSAQSSVLKKGSQGDKVSALQQRLFDLGYYTGLIDGDFGSKTEEAFKLFQKAAGLYVDGIAGSDTEYLFADDAPSYQEEAAEEVVQKAEEEVAESGAENSEEPTEANAPLTFKKGDFDEKLIPVQQKLIDLGYLQGDADGSFGALTEEAVRSFQSANGITATGEVNEQTYQLLFSNAPLKKATEAPTEAKAATTASKNVAAARAVTPTSAPKTEVEVKTSELSNKALSGVTDSIGFKQSANATNFQFILWLGVMIVLMLITFAIVYAVEKKKRRAHTGRRYQ